MALRITRERQRCCLCGLLRNVGHERVGCGNLPTCFCVVTAIQCQMPLFLSGKDGHSNDNPFKHRTQHFAVVTVGPTERNGEGNAFGIGQEVAFGS